MVSNGGARPEASLLPSSAAITIGQRCYSVENSQAGGRALTSCTVSGRLQSSAGEPRFILRFATGPGTPGAPVVNEHGELIGLVGGGGPISVWQRAADLRSTNVLSAGENDSF
jgi:hypothetical protein